jgi:phosphohistidine phosphatase
LDYKIKDIAIDERLYAATEFTVLDIIEELRDKLDRVMLVGHNPGFAELAHHFDSGITHMPTCALVEFRFEAGSWAGIGRARPSSMFVDSPKRP